MELTQLLQFKTVAECENVTRAGEILHVSQPTISKACKNLEEELGISLFYRDAKGMHPNQRAKEILTHVNNILSELAEIQAMAEYWKKTLERVSFGSTSMGLLRYFFGLLKPIPDLPFCSFVIKPEDIVGALYSSRIDIALSYEHLEGSGIACIHFGYSQTMLSIPYNHPLAHKSSVTFQDLVGFPIVRMREKDNFLTEKLAVLSNENKVILNILYVEDFGMFQSLLKSSDMIAFASNLSDRYTNYGSNRRIVPFAAGDTFKHSIYLSFLDSKEDSLGPVLSQLWPLISPEND